MQSQCVRRQLRNRRGRVVWCELVKNGINRTVALTLHLSMTLQNCELSLLFPYPIWPAMSLSGLRQGPRLLRTSNEKSMAFCHFSDEGHFRVTWTSSILLPVCMRDRGRPLTWRREHQKKGTALSGCQSDGWTVTTSWRHTKKGDHWTTLLTLFSPLSLSSFLLQLSTAAFLFFSSGLCVQGRFWDQRLQVRSSFLFVCLFVWLDNLPAACHEPFRPSWR